MFRQWDRGRVLSLPRWSAPTGAGGQGSQVLWLKPLDASGPPGGRWSVQPHSEVASVLSGPSGRQDHCGCSRLGRELPRPGLSPRLLPSSRRSCSTFPFSSATFLHRPHTPVSLDVPHVLLLHSLRSLPGPCPPPADEAFLQQRDVSHSPLYPSCFAQSWHTRAVRKQCSPVPPFSLFRGWTLSGRPSHSRRSLGVCWR